jgi:hypothetical protein
VSHHDVNGLRAAAKLAHRAPRSPTRSEAFDLKAISVSPEGQSHDLVLNFHPAEAVGEVHTEDLRTATITISDDVEHSQFFQQSVPSTADNGSRRPRVDELEV